MTKMQSAFGSVAWHVTILVLILIAPGWLRFGLLPWDLPEHNLLILLTLGATYAFVAVASVALPRVYARLSPLLSLLALSMLMAATFLAMLVIPLDRFSRPLLLVAAILVATGILASMLWSHGRRALAALFVAPSFAVMAALYVLSSDPAEPSGKSVSREIIRASAHTVSATRFQNFFPHPGKLHDRGGAITPDPFGNAYLLARPQGGLYRISFPDDGARLDIQEVAKPVPANAAQFYTESGVGRGGGFRIGDLLARMEGERVRVYASHHFWHSQEKCFTVRVSTLWLQDDSAAGLHEDWQTLFESRPCLKVRPGDRGIPFGGEQIGGNIEALPDGRLLLTVGDHQFDGWYHPQNLVQDPETDYGKTLTIDPATGEAELFTQGHRNPQGLFVDQQSRIWSTEHGPQGGDELNLLRKGLNYGYPYQTYGTEYGSVTWPAADAARDSDEFELPQFAWTPSIGISDLIAVDAADWPRWAGDLIIASLKRQAIWRVRLEGDQVAYAEPISIGERVRDIAQGPGEIVLWTDNESIIKLEPVDTLDNGAMLYAVKCSGCHDDRVNGIGPRLYEMVGRRVATVDGYGYSSALVELGGRWTEKRLDEFLKSPEVLAPGTRMAGQGVADPEARRKIIEYLDSGVYNYLAP